MQVHVIHEIDCSVERIDPAVVEAFLDAELSDDPMLADSICAMADAMSAELHPRGVYKLFNPAICTLPPKYTEPAIKLVGTLAVLYGSAAYERMSEAEHTAMVVSTVGTDEAAPPSWTACSAWAATAPTRPRTCSARRA